MRSTRTSGPAIPTASCRMAPPRRRGRPPAGVADAHRRENPNGAKFLFVADRARSDKVADYKRCFELFDGRDDTAVAESRERWKAYTAAGTRSSTGNRRRPALGEEGLISPDRGSSPAHAHALLDRARLRAHDHEARETRAVRDYERPGRPASARSMIFSRGKPVAAPGRLQALPGRQPGPSGR